jgi:hypothetical protein
MEGNHKKLRFSAESINDLLFWGVHLMVVGISLAVVWTKLDSTTHALLKIITLQNQEMAVVQEQALSAKHQAEQAELGRTQAAEEASQTKAALKIVLNQQGEFRGLATKTVDEMSARFDAIQTNVLATLDQIKNLQAQLAGTAKTSQTQAAVAQVVATSASARAAARAQALAAKRRQLRHVDKKLTQLKDRNIIQRLLNTQ